MERAGSPPALSRCAQAWRSFQLVASLAGQLGESAHAGPSATDWACSLAVSTTVDASSLVVATTLWACSLAVSPTSVDVVVP